MEEKIKQLEISSLKNSIEDLIDYVIAIKPEIHYHMTSIMLGDKYIENNDLFNNELGEV